ncbi:hypothetical protein FB45DRAFT_997068 [Roridomyces roridus]|uniref:F-box domain-containing protein n=1 Tax=Roridomyces roridus TaxID=1738132 RepID=A0AAD7CI71_9AGAR|nr:hypothetical protein FB45DRAFT_997068 [Roridomyces roridus]
MHQRIYCDHPCSMDCGASQPLVSPLPELFASNDIPSDLQAAPILEALQNARTEIARVDAAIANLTAQRAGLVNFIHRHASVVSGLRCFPNELLTEIFLRCVDLGRFDPLTNRPWIVARVCRRWRDVALSCPELWRHFVVPEKCPSHIDRFFKMQLDRARHAPIAIWMPDREMYLQSNDGEDEIDVPSDEFDVLGVLLKVAPQWQEIQLTTKHDFTRFASHGVVYPQLKTLRLNIMDDIWSDDLVDHDLASALPALVHLDWCTLDKPFPRQPFLPWSQLRTLVLHYPRLPDALWVLSVLSSNTTDVSFISGSQDAVIVDSESVDSQIRSLDINGCDEPFSSGLLGRVVAPALENLLLNIYKQFPVQETLSLLSTSACSLKHLRVVDGDVPSLIELLESPSAREIVRLEVSVKDFYVLLQALAIKDRLVPQLRTLVIEGNCDQNAALGILVDRKPSVRNIPFEALNWHWDRFPERRIADGGLDVVILTR